MRYKHTWMIAAIYNDKCVSPLGDYQPELPQESRIPKVKQTGNLQNPTAYFAKIHSSNCESCRLRNAGFEVLTHHPPSADNLK
jgi:hypothetical protein